MIKNIINNKWKVIEKTSGIYLPTMNLNRFINKDSKVCLMGSCFADEMGWALRSRGVNIGDHGEVRELKHILYQLKKYLMIPTLKPG